MLRCGPIAGCNLQSSRFCAQGGHMFPSKHQGSLAVPAGQAEHCASSALAAFLHHGLPHLLLH